MTVFDLDDQPFSPNFNKGALTFVVFSSLKYHLPYEVLAGPRAMVALTAISDPSICSFYYINGTSILVDTTTKVPVYNRIEYNSAYGYAIRVRPADNLYSESAFKPLCSLTFVAIDGVTMERSLSSANISVAVMVSYYSIKIL